MSIHFEPIGYVKTQTTNIPQHWSVSNEKGELVINLEFLPGIMDIQTGQKIIVLFYFHKSPEFSSKYLRQTPPHLQKEYGVFSICSPRRPNPIGLSILEVLEVKDNIIQVNRLDMLDGTPILDIKPYIEDKP